MPPQKKTPLRFLARERIAKLHRDCDKELYTEPHLLCCERSASESLSELRLDHVERGLNVRALVVVLKKLCAVQTVEVIHPSPKL
jgi:hypothetical protein